MRVGSNGPKSFTFSICHKDSKVAGSEPLAVPANNDEVVELTRAKKRPASPPSEPPATKVILKELYIPLQRLNLPANGLILVGKEMVKVHVAVSKSLKPSKRAASDSPLPDGVPAKVVRRETTPLLLSALQNSTDKPKVVSEQEIVRPSKRTASPSSLSGCVPAKVAKKEVVPPLLPVHVSQKEAVHQKESKKELVPKSGLLSIERTVSPPLPAPAKVAVVEITPPLPPASTCGGLDKAAKAKSSKKPVSPLLTRVGKSKVASQKRPLFFYPSPALLKEANKWTVTSLKEASKSESVPLPLADVPSGSRGDLVQPAKVLNPSPKSKKEKSSKGAGPANQLRAKKTPAPSKAKRKPSPAPQTGSRASAVAVRRSARIQNQTAGISWSVLLLFLSPTSQRVNFEGGICF